MQLQTIDVFIDKEGNVEIKVNGVKGMTCTDVTKALEETLGGDIESREMTHEAHEVELSRDINLEQSQGW